MQCMHAALHCTVYAVQRKGAPHRLRCCPGDVPRVAWQVRALLGGPHLRRKEQPHNTQVGALLGQQLEPGSQGCGRDRQLPSTPSRPVLSQIGQTLNGDEDYTTCGLTP